MADPDPILVQDPALQRIPVTDIDACGVEAMTTMNFHAIRLNDNWYTYGNPVEIAQYLESDAPRAAVVALKVKQIKEFASEYILARYPIWKQMNMNMRAVELINIVLQRAWTTDEQTEALFLQSTATWIKQVRAYSNTLEASVNDSLKTWQQIAAIDITADWPA